MNQDVIIFNKLAEKNGCVIFKGKTFALISPAQLTNRDFFGWWGDAKEGEEYISEWSAPAMGEDGNEYVVRWRFDATRGQEPADDSDWPWEDNVYEVIEV